MREFVRSMECNQKLINQLGYSCRGRGSSLFDKWTSIRDYETAKKMLSETTIENIADEIGLIGTAYFLAEQCKSVKYHSRQAGCCLQRLLQKRRFSSRNKDFEKYI